MPTGERIKVGSLDTLRLCFPSGRMAHRLVARLGLLPQYERQKEVCEVILPRLVKGDSIRRDNPSYLSLEVLFHLTSDYSRAIGFVDALLEGQK
ncbi:hypothetical protein AAHC03_017260 [Spirometra sp. Aus1]